MHISTSSRPEDFNLATKNLFPPLTSHHHKGKCGRLMVIGGSFEYTGAPFFAAISALKLGADLVHVCCPRDAGVVIKSYSPELIVHPLLDDKERVDEMVGWLTQMHGVVVGPGLGTGEAVLENVQALIGEVQKIGLPLVIDADGLRLVTKNPSLITNHHNTIITPNAVEFRRLCNALGLNQQNSSDIPTATEQLAGQLGNVTVVRKGPQDVITDGINTVTCDHPGSPRRCGGQGDILAGFACTLAYWARLNNNNNNNNINNNINNNHNNDNNSNKNNNNNTNKDSEQNNVSRSLQQQLGPAMTAAAVACLLTRQTSLQTFHLKGRSMLATDMIEQIPEVVKGCEW